MSLIDLILTYGPDGEKEQQLRKEIAAHTTAVVQSARGCDRNEVFQAEQAVKADPAKSFEFDPEGSASLTIAGRSWRAGRFETPTIEELRTRVRHRATPGTGGRVRLWVLDGASPVTDIGSLQATADRGTLFQVASQFNCLESPGPYVTPVANYFGDPTQGPRASISAFPATLLRHYAAPGPNGKRFVQATDKCQIELLAGACGPGVSRNGYFSGNGLANPKAVVDALENQFDAIRVGVHDNAQVVRGYNWDGAVVESEHRCIAQVFTSTASGGGYGAEHNLGPDAFRVACRQLLRAAYLGTLLATVAVGRNRAVLTLIGGGVFQNPIEFIWDAIQWSIDQVEPLLSQDLDVIVNGYNFGAQIDLEAEVLPAVKKRGGAILTFNRSGLAEIRR